MRMDIIKLLNKVIESYVIEILIEPSIPINP